MPVDDLGNQRIDFVWGNMPLKSNYDDSEEVNYRAPWEEYPGDGEGEYFMKGHYDGTFPSIYLDAKDSHVVALRNWKGFPDVITDGDSGFQRTVDWWESNQPAYQFPNIVGKTEAEAIKSLIECGVNPALLVPAEFDAPEELRYIGYDPESGYFNILNAPGAGNPAVIFYRYYEPGTVIGTHWDGRPWLAEESEGVVAYTNSWLGETVPVGDSMTSEDPEVTGGLSWWHTFVVIQTTDPLKDSYIWWND